MAYARLQHAGAAVVTTLSGAITSGDTSANLTASTGWPDGSVGPFYAVIDAGLATEEKVLITSRTSLTLNTITRGVDGTSASAHASGASISHCFTAVEADEANVAVNKTIGQVTTKGDLIAATASQTLARLAAGANSTVLHADSGAATGLSYSKIVEADITAATITAASLATDAVTTVKITDANVTTAKIADANVTTAKIATSNITNALMADDAIDSAEIADGAIDTVHFALGAIGGVLDVAATGGPIGGSEVVLGTINIPAQPAAYTLDASAFWSGYNSADNESFSMSIKVATVLKGKIYQRHTGGDNTRLAYAIPCITLTSVAASTAVAVTVSMIREDGSGNLTEEQAGRLVVKVYPKALAS